MRPLTVVVAWDADRVIGRDGGLPWHHPADLAHFRRTTLGHAIVMGRRCHEAIGRALPGRRNLVVTRNPAFRAPGVEAFPSFEAALEAAYETDPAPCVVGGAEIYALAMPRATRLVVTEIPGRHEGDVVFPAFDEAAWVETARQEAGELVFRVLERRA